MRGMRAEGASLLVPAQSRSSPAPTARVSAGSSSRLLAPSSVSPSSGRVSSPSAELRLAHSSSGSRSPSALASGRPPAASLSSRPQLTPLALSLSSRLSLWLRLHSFAGFPLAQSLPAPDLDLTARVALSSSQISRLSSSSSCDDLNPTARSGLSLSCRPPL